MSVGTEQRESGDLATRAPEQGRGEGAPSPHALPAAARPAGTRVVLLTVAASVLLLTFQPLAGFDTWWHLASGREMVRTGGLLRSDPFTFTVAGTEWRNHEWLWQLGAYGLFRLAGGGDGHTARDGTAPVAPGVASNGQESGTGRPAGLLERDRDEAWGASILTVVNGLLLTACFVLGFATLLDAGCSLPAASATVIFGAVGARPRFLARPEAATLLILALVLYLLQRSRSTGRIWPLPIIPVLIAVGVNMHPGGLAVAGLVAVYLIADRIVGRRRLPLGHAGVAGLAGATLVATSFTPAGVGIWGILFDVTGVSRGEGYYNPEWVVSTPANAPLLYIALTAFAGLLAISWHRRVFDAPTALVQAGLTLLAISAYRHLGLYFVALPFAAAIPMAAVAPSANGRGARQPQGRPVMALSLLFPGLALVWLLGQGGPSLGVDRTTTPVDACRFLDRHPPEGRLYNDLRFGGYLDWRFAPARRTFIDGRQELFPQLLPRLAAIHSGAAPYSSWLDLLEEQSIEGGIVRYQEGKKGVLYPGPQGGPPIRGYRAYSAYLFPGPAWVLVYWDDTAMVFLSRNGANAALIDRFGYEALNPEDADYLLERAEDDNELRAALTRDIRRRLAEDPPSLRAAELQRRMEQRGW